MQTIVAHEEDSSTENSRIGRSLFLNGPKAPKVPSQNITVSRARSRTRQGQARWAPAAALTGAAGRAHAHRRAGSAGKPHASPRERDWQEGYCRLS